MTKEELTKRLEAAEKQNLGLLDEIKYLKEKLAEMQDEPEIPDMPVFYASETYWRMYPTLEHIKDSVLHSDYNGECYNLFHTKEYAAEFAEKCKLIAMMLHCKWYTEKELFKFDSGIDGYFPPVYTVVYSKPMEEYAVVKAHVFEGSQIYFKSEGAAQKAADWLNEHWKENENE